MKIFLLIPLIIGGLLIGIGIRESNNRLQPGDVRVGGDFLMMIGVAIIAVTLAIYFLIFVFS